MPTPRMAASDSLDAKPDSLQRSPFIDCIHHVLTAGRFKTAIGAEQGGQGPLIELDGKYEYLFEHVLKCITPGWPVRVKHGVCFMR